MRILVTGAAGLIGSHIAELLTENGHDVVGLDLREEPYAPERMRIADVRSVTAGDLRGVDAVCHQAAMVGLGVDIVPDLPAYTEVNAGGTAALLSAMASAGVARLVLASSMVVYGEGGYSCTACGRVAPGPRGRDRLEAGEFEPPCPQCGRALLPEVVEETAPIDPRNVYAATKVAQEHLASAWARATGGTVSALRYHNVYGPRMPRDTPYAGVAAIFRSALERGDAPRVFEDGYQRRDFVHVRDVARANVLALTTEGRPGEARAFNIASGVPHTVGEMATALAKEFQSPEGRSSPDPVVTGEYNLGDVRHIVASPARAAAEIGFHAEIGFDEGMAEFATAPLRAVSPS